MHIVLYKAYKKNKVPKNKRCWNHDDGVTEVVNAVVAYVVKVVLYVAEDYRCGIAVNAEED